MDDGKPLEDCCFLADQLSPCREATALLAHYYYVLLMSKLRSWPVLRNSAQLTSETKAKCLVIEQNSRNKEKCVVSYVTYSEERENVWILPTKV